MLHVMLPTASIDPARASANPFMFVDSGVPQFFREAYAAGAVKNRLVVKVAGGASVGNVGEDRFAIGRRNYITLKKLFWQNGVLIRPRPSADIFRERCPSKWAGGACGFPPPARRRNSDGRKLSGGKRCGPSATSPRKGGEGDAGTGVPRQRWGGTTMALNVLVVDDSGIMRTRSSRVLNMTGLDIGEVHQAGNGQEGLAGCQEKWIDLVLVDINMPVMDGEEMIHRMRADDDLRDLPVIVVSTEGSRTRIERLERGRQVHSQTVLGGGRPGNHHEPHGDQP